MGKKNNFKKEDTKLLNSISECTYKCKHCGRSVVIARYEKSLCPDCGHWVFKEDRDEFKYRLLERMKKNER